MNNQATKCGIYIMTNPAFKEYIKIGYAKDIDQRLKVLSGSSVPFSFRLYAYYETDLTNGDKKVHSIIDMLNNHLRATEEYNGKLKKKEFFTMEAEDAYLFFHNIACISGTEDKLHKMELSASEKEDEKQATEIRNRARKEPFRFSLCNIEIGSEIAFVDDPSKTATVTGDKTVEYDGIPYSLSALAKLLRNNNNEVQGPDWFTYKGEKLTAIRNRTH